jgi:hypothetical protein
MRLALGRIPAVLFRMGEEFMEHTDIATRVRRSVKGAVVTTTAVWVCSLIVAEGFAVSRRNKNPDAAFAVDFTPLFFFAVSLGVLPVAMKIGMFLLGEKNNALLITAATLSWATVGWLLFETLDSPDSHVPLVVLAVYAIGGGGASWASSPGKSDSQLKS